jgi:hypothetical protein
MGPLDYAAFDLGEHEVLQQEDHLDERHQRSENTGHVELLIVGGATIAPIPVVRLKVSARRTKCFILRLLMCANDCTCLAGVLRSDPGTQEMRGSGTIDRSAVGEHNSLLSNP